MKTFKYFEVHIPTGEFILREIECRNVEDFNTVMAGWNVNGLEYQKMEWAYFPAVKLKIHDIPKQVSEVLWRGSIYNLEEAPR